MAEELRTTGRLDRDVVPAVTCRRPVIAMTAPMLTITNKSDTTTYRAGLATETSGVNAARAKMKVRSRCRTQGPEREPVDLRFAREHSWYGPEEDVCQSEDGKCANKRQVAQAGVLLKSAEDQVSGKERDERGGRFGHVQRNAAVAPSQNRDRDGEHRDSSAGHGRTSN